MKFLDRIGVTKPSQFVQIDSADESLRNHLWNALGIFIGSKLIQIICIRKIFIHNYHGNFYCYLHV